MQKIGINFLQSTHRRPPYTLPATLPVTRIFFYYPTRTLPEVKKPYPSQPGQETIFKSTANTHKIFISVGGLVHQAEFFMDEVLNNARPDLCECDANGDEDDPDGRHGAPDHRAALHGERLCGRVCSAA